MKINENKLIQLEKEFDKQMNKANGGYMNELLAILNGVQQERERVKNPIFGAEDMPPPCGFERKKENIDAKKQININTEVQEIKRIIKNDPMKFPEISSSLVSVSSGGDSGSEEGVVVFAELSKPSWVTKIKSDLKSWSYAERQTSKDWYDVEDLIRGVETKERAKKYEPKDVVYTIIDTSGSMGETGKGGKTYLEILGGYIPHIVSSFDGEVWCVDTKVQDVKSNKEAFDIFKSANTLAKNSLALAGGGATDFKSAFERLLAIKERDKKDIMVIILTDAGLSWDIGMLQEIENVIIVAPEEGSEYMPWNFLNNPKYPNAHGIIVNFFNNEYKTS